MANFDSNMWYEVFNTGATDALSLLGSSLYNDGENGTVFYQGTNNSLPSHQWQIYTYNTSYVLRTKDSGPNGVLGVAVGVNQTVAGSTVPYMVKYTLAGNSMFWQISPWGDGTFFFTNSANGSAWHLEVEPNTLMTMSSNITAPQPAQQYFFSTISAINDSKFSTINTPPATGTTTASTSPNTSTTPPSSTTTAAPGASSGGLSTGASAAIGASIGVVGLIALLLAGYFLLRRRKRRAAAAAVDPMHELPSQRTQELSEMDLKKQAPDPNLMSELQVPPAELYGRERAADPVELPGNDATSEGMKGDGRSP